MFDMQQWLLTSSGEIRRDEGCIDYAGKYVMVYPCHGMKGNQEWIYGMVSYYLFVLPYVVDRKIFAAGMRSKNAPNGVLKAPYIAPYGGQTSCRY